MRGACCAGDIRTLPSNGRATLDKLSSITEIIGNLRARWRHPKSPGGGMCRSSLGKGGPASARFGAVRKRGWGRFVPPWPNWLQSCDVILQANGHREMNIRKINVLAGKRSPRPAPARQNSPGRERAWAAAFAYRKVNYACR